MNKDVLLRAAIDVLMLFTHVIVIVSELKRRRRMLRKWRQAGVKNS